jgi:hypothetical protein
MILLSLKAIPVACPTGVILFVLPYAEYLLNYMEIPFVIWFHRYVCMCIYHLSVYPSVYLPISIYLSIYLSIYIYVSIYYLSIYWENSWLGYYNHKSFFDLFVTFPFPFPYSSKEV